MYLLVYFTYSSPNFISPILSMSPFSAYSQQFCRVHSFHPLYARSIDYMNKFPKNTCLFSSSLSLVFLPKFVSPDLICHPRDPAPRAANDLLPDDESHFWKGVSFSQQLLLFNVVNQTGFHWIRSHQDYESVKNKHFFCPKNDGSSVLSAHFSHLSSADFRRMKKKQKKKGAK